MLLYRVYLFSCQRQHSTAGMGKRLTLGTTATHELLAEDMASECGVHGLSIAPQALDSILSQHDDLLTDAFIPNPMMHGSSEENIFCPVTPSSLAGPRPLIQPSTWLASTVRLGYRQDVRIMETLTILR